MQIEANSVSCDSIVMLSKSRSTQLFLCLLKFKTKLFKAKPKLNYQSLFLVYAMQIGNKTY